VECRSVGNAFEEDGGEFFRRVGSYPGLHREFFAHLELWAVRHGDAGFFAVEFQTGAVDARLPAGGFDRPVGFAVQIFDGAAFVLVEGPGSDGGGRRRGGAGGKGGRDHEAEAHDEAQRGIQC